MKSILIVDDEYLVRLGLKTTIDWTEHGYVIAGEASNGKEALEIFDRIGADVILTDIKMPVMDGLELTRAVKKKNKKVQIIILSHYDEFAYAQEALKLGAFQYILKSELTKINLLNVLKSLFYAATTEETDPAEKEDNGFTENREHYIENYLFPFFTDVKPEDAKLPLPNDVFLSGAPGRQIIMAGRCRITTLLFDAKKMFPKTIKVLIAEAFAGSAFFGDYRSEQFLFIAIVPVPLSPPSARPHDKMIEACSRIVKNVRQYYDVSIFIGLSSEGNPADMLSLFSESQAALKMCFFSEKNFASRYDQRSAETRGKPPQISYTRLFDMIDLNQKDAILEYIQNVFRQLRTLKNYMQVHDTFIDFLSIGKLIREKYNLQEQASLSESKFNYDTFFDLEFIGDVEFYLYGIFLALLASKQGEKTLYSFIVKKCITFIKNNYSKNITLSDAAKNAEVSHSYLSFIFKQETGINFNIYLSRWRVEQAKKLLKSTNMRIYEVAERVGFSNPYYFSKVFKELTGVSCKDFRDLTMSSD